MDGLPNHLEEQEVGAGFGEGVGLASVALLNDRGLVEGAGLSG